MCEASITTHCHLDLRHEGGVLFSRGSGTFTTLNTLGWGETFTILKLPRSLHFYHQKVKISLRGAFRAAHPSAHLSPHSRAVRPLQTTHMCTPERQQCYSCGCAVRAGHRAETVALTRPLRPTQFPSARRIRHQLESAATALASRAISTTSSTSTRTADRSTATPTS